MRIASDARMYGPSVTGIGNYVKHLTDELFKVDKENEYVMLMLEPEFSKFQPPHHRVQKIKVNTRWYSWREQLQLGLEYNHWASRHHIDLFHFPHFNVPITFKGKFVVTVHDITPKFFPGPKAQKSLVRKFGYEVVFKSALRKAAKIIAVSQHTKEQIVANFHVPADKIAVVHNGLDPTFQKVADYGIIKKLKDKYGITKPFIFYTGVWREHKNLPGLLWAFEILVKNQLLDYQLVLGGDNQNSDPRIPQTIKELKLESRLVTPGFIPEQELSTFYSAAAITVIPSFCEGFGFLALESLACGTPVVASKTTSVPEILGGASLYFDPALPKEVAATILKVLQNPSLRQELVDKGREEIKKYSWERCANETLKIYQEIYVYKNKN